MTKDDNLFDFYYAKKYLLFKNRKEQLAGPEMEKIRIICGDNIPRQRKDGSFKTAKTPEEWENQNRYIRIDQEKIAVWQHYYQEKQLLLNACCEFAEQHHYSNSAAILKKIEEFNTNLGVSFCRIRKQAWHLYVQSAATENHISS